MGPEKAPAGKTLKNAETGKNAHKVDSADQLFKKINL